MAYAALSSLARTLTHTTLDTREITQSELAEIDSLHSTLRRLGHRRYRGIDRSEINELEAKIRDAAWKLQDVIELYQISQGLDDEGVEQEIDSFFQTAEKLREDYEKALENSWFVEEDIVDDGAIQNNSNIVYLMFHKDKVVTFIEPTKFDPIAQAHMENGHEGGVELQHNVPYREDLADIPLPQ